VVAKSKGNAMSLHHGPTIDELLADSLIQTVMRADQVEPQALRALLNGAASRITATRRERAAERSGVVFAKSPSERRGWEPDAPLAARWAPRVRGEDCRSALCC
jgi:hypothetical protein